MVFCLDDLKNGDTLTKIQVFIMVEMNKHPLTTFKSLSLGGQRKFNEKLNLYINTLPELGDGWQLKVQEDFNTACIEELYTNKFKAEAQFCPILNTEPIRLRREGEEEMDINTPL